MNFTLFFHSIEVVQGKFTSKDEPGELSHLQALAAAISGTIGMGTIAGVAVAVAMGGPGAIFLDGGCRIFRNVGQIRRSDFRP